MKAISATRIMPGKFGISALSYFFLFSEESPIPQDFEIQVWIPNLGRIHLFSTYQAAMPPTSNKIRVKSILDPWLTE